MNTLGDWQEKLTWLVGRMYGRMVPVAIYKYGVIRPGVMFGQTAEGITPLTVSGGDVAMEDPIPLAFARQIAGPSDNTSHQTRMNQDWKQPDPCHRRIHGWNGSSTTAAAGSAGPAEV